MINKKILLTTALAFLALIYSCSDSPTSIGSNLLSPDELNVYKIDSFQDSIPQTSAYFKTQIKLSDSPRLLVGKYENVTASSLIRFAVVLSDSLKNAFLNSNLNIVNAKVKLTREYKIGNTTNPLNYSVHFVNSGWSSFGFNADSIQSLDIDSLVDISSGKTYSDSTYTFDLNQQTIISWFQIASDTVVHMNNGIYIKPDITSEGIIGFDAFNVSLKGIPSLNVIVETGGVVDTLNFYSIEDVSAVKGDIPSVPAGDIAVQGSLAADARVKFDLSALSKGAIINKAELTIYIDSTATRNGSPFTNSLSAYFATDSSANTYDTTSAIVLSRFNNYFTGNIAPFIQSIASGYHNNNGIILAAGGQNLGVDIFALFGSEASDHSLRPRLVITYTGRK